MATQTPGRTVRLKDGRFLGYAEFGDPQGRPAFFFHGFPGSRREAGLGDGAAKAAGVRLIALDRPGMGLSDFKRRRTFLDWPQDVLAAADALGLENFAVAGVSGGGPYVAACALKIAQRLTAAGIISGVGPLDAPEATKGMSRQNRIGFFLGGRLPWLGRVVMAQMGRKVRRTERAKLMARLARSFAEVDRPILQRPEIAEWFHEDLREAFRRGSRGPAHELVMYSRPWGFRLEDISMPVHLWQGDADINVPLSMGHYQAHAIPNCRATFYPGEGHLLCVDRMGEMLAAMLPA